MPLFRKLLRAVSDALYRGAELLDPPDRVEPKIAPWDLPGAQIIAEPWNCPTCGCKIELDEDGAEYRCVGCRDRDEVDTYLAPTLPVELPPRGTIQKLDDGEDFSWDVMPSCGWHDSVENFGKTWTSDRERKHV